jgi:hypothetical protein
MYSVSNLGSKCSETKAQCGKKTSGGGGKERLLPEGNSFPSLIY